ncbi:MAG: hypothetical protein U0892_20175 [Pirellulales bacterium]
MSSRVSPWGAATGPIEADTGAVVGGLAGGLAGKNVAEAIEPTAEHEFWKHEYSRREATTRAFLTKSSNPHSDTAGNLAVGIPIAIGMKCMTISVASGKIASLNSPLATWEDAQRPIRDAWDRVEERIRNRRSSHA